MNLCMDIMCCTLIVMLHTRCCCTRLLTSPLPSTYIHNSYWLQVTFSIYVLLGWFLDYGATPFSNLQSKHAHFYRSMWKTWIPLALEKVEGPSTSLIFFGNHLRYQPDGNPFTRWEAPTYSQRNTQLATEEECHKEGDSFSDWPSAACQQSGEMWSYLCRTDVSDGCIRRLPK